MKSTTLPDDADYVSRSAQKRQAQVAKAIGERLAALNRDQLRALDLPELILDAIADYQRFTSHGARRRQMLLIGKYLREFDADALDARVAAMEHADARSIYRHHQAEQWRDRLSDDPGAFPAFLDAFPGADREEIQNLLRRLRKATDPAMQRTHKRSLYRHIFELL
jgi:ribosome-associated protein